MPSVRTVIQVILSVAVVSFAGCGGNDGTTKPTPVGDTTPPQTTDHLLDMSHPGRSVSLAWPAPGDDGRVGRVSRYDVRYSADSLTEATWSAAIPLEFSRVPALPGAWETFETSEIPLGVWYFALKSADEVPNWSGLSNVVRVTVADVIPPGTIANLSVAATARRSVTLRWTAPGNDGANGTAAAYDLRYADTPITNQNWESAIPAENAPIPSAAGSTDSMTVTGLNESTQYYFGLKACDQVPNWSAVSNVIQATTTTATMVRITHSPPNTFALAPSWSPDGTEIAFCASWSGHGNVEIYRMPMAGGAAVRLTNDPAWDDAPSWSPDGTRIAFISDRGGVTGLWVMNAADGSELLLLADTKGWVSGCRASWYPDGSRLAYTYEYEGPYSPSSIRTVSAEGGSDSLLLAAGEGWRNFNPAWSPDGSRIAFTSDRDGLWHRIWVAATDGSSPRLLTSRGESALEPCWSPDGQRVAYRVPGMGKSEIWSIPLSGGDPTRLSPPSLQLGLPSWSPDGTRIATDSSWTDFASSEIWVIELDSPAP